ncbi:MAG: magnesium transporter [Vampirovibrionales bacterium]
MLPEHDNELNIGITTPTVPTEQESLHEQEAQIRQERETLTDIISGRVREHIYKKQPRFVLRQYLNTVHFADIADALEDELTPNEALVCLDAIAPALASKILTSLEPETQQRFILAIPSVKLHRIIRAMPADDAVDLLQELSLEEAGRVLGGLPQDADTQSLHELLKESPDTAVGIMSTHYVSLHENATVGDALLLLQNADEHDFVYYLYLTDEDHVLKGVLSIKSLLLAYKTPERLLKELALVDDVKHVHEAFDQELVANIFRKYYNLLAMPVVDDDDHLLGIITLDDIIDVIDEESQEDLYRTSGIRIDEEVDEQDLLKGKPIYAFRARIPWLSVTLIGQLCVASIIGYFHNTVSHTVAAVSFLPLLCGLAGNVGTQSDTISVRGIALELIDAKNIRQQAVREIRVALMIGGLFALVLGGASFLMYGHVFLSLILMGYVLLSNCISALMGVLIPYVIKFGFKQDPAGVGGPFITTIMDLSMYTSFLLLLTWLGDKII